MVEYQYFSDKNKRSSKDMIVALKKLNNSQNISNDFLNEVNNLLLLSLFFILKRIHYYLLLNKNILLVQKLY